MSCPFFLLLLAAAPWIQDGRTAPAVSPDLQAWRAQHGEEWILRANPRTATGQLLFGGTAESPFQPGGDQEWEFLARDQVEAVRPMFQIPESTLVLRYVKPLLLERIGSSNKTVVVFDQVVRGIPVAGGSMSVLFGPRAELLAVDATAFPAVDTLSVVPALGPELAQDLARWEFARRENRRALHAGTAALVIYPHEAGSWLRPRLAWAVEVRDPGAEGKLPAGWRVFVAADQPEPEVLGAEQLVHRCGALADVTGSVAALATPADAAHGYLPDTAANPPLSELMPYLDVTSPAGNATSDENGDFVIPGAGTTPVPVTFGFSGPYARVENQAGSNYSETVSFSPGTPATVVLNSVPTEQVTAQANAFLQVNRFRQWIESVDPADPTMDFQVLVKVNHSASCNAFFDGASLNFYRAGGACANTAYSTIIAHEEGHWANLEYGTSNDRRGIGEGVADAWAMYVYDTATVGDGISGAGTSVRTGGSGNTRAFCGDGAPGCYGEEHDDGEVLMGALWKVREALNATHGNATGDDTANVLFVAWLQAYDDQLITTLIRDHWLILDDDDGDVQNGTPNQADIEAGFLAHRFPPFSSELPAGETTRVSVDSLGGQGNRDCYNASISADGRYVAFESNADNLVPGDTNSATDVFVHDRQTGLTSRASVAAAGTQGNAESFHPALSAAGRYVAFASYADNLVPGDGNFSSDVFVQDRQTGSTSRVSVDSAGMESNFDSLDPVLSSDGRFVAFWSLADNLVPGDANFADDVFVHDRQTGRTTLVSVSSTGVQGNWNSIHPAISADGRYVAFHSGANNLVPGDTNGITDDVFVHDRATGSTIRVSVDSAGLEGNGYSRFPSLAGDGLAVAFHSAAANLVPGDTNGSVDIFVHELPAARTIRVSVSSTGAPGNWHSFDPALSQDGRSVAFHSVAGNLVPGDSNGNYDVFVHHLPSGHTRRVSVDSAGGEANDGSYQPCLSSSGRWVAFESYASNLVPGDTNDAADVLIHDSAAPYLVQGPLLRGQRTWFEVGGADAGEAVYFLASPTGLGAGPCPGALGGLCLDLLDPITLFGTASAGASGVAFFEFTVPAKLSARALYTQAVIPRGPAGAGSVKTNAVAAPVYP